MAASKAAALYAEAVASSSHASPSAAPRSYPTHAELLPEMLSADYSAMLACPFDHRAHAMPLPPQPSGSDDSAPAASAPPRSLCPHGAVARCRFEVFSGAVGLYSGMFANGAANCIVRVSTAAQPAPRPESMLGRLGQFAAKAMAGKIINSTLFPFVAIKACCDGVGRPSANLLFAGCKTGQESRDVLESAVATMMTEKVGVALMPVVANMRAHSAHPLALGVSNWASVDESGAPCDDPRFPWAVVLMPTAEARALMADGLTRNDDDAAASGEPPRFDGFIDALVASVATGTALYDVFACAAPVDAVTGGRGLQRIGRMTTTSSFVHSGPSSSLFFQHQRKEEDYALRPEWLTQLGLPCGDDGGTVATHAGWKVFQRHIVAGRYTDGAK